MPLADRRERLATTAVPERQPCVVATEAHPLLSAWCDPVLSLRQRDSLPSIAALEHERARMQALDGITRPAFCRQDATLLADGQHYETRIAHARLLATREQDPHDVFNALVWLRHPQLKWALNARQVADIAEVGTKRRTRGQCALTHFDEAGAIVWLADDALLPHWDAHDWQALFVRERAAWGRSIAVTVFGHALVEHVRDGHRLPVAKCLAVRAAPGQLASLVGDAAIVLRWHDAEARIAAEIAAGRLLADPQELRPLPLAGIPGWHEGAGSETFVRTAPCFRPLRAGRCYPSPWSGLVD
jgi:hypothetical protein